MVLKPVEQISAKVRGGFHTRSDTRSPAIQELAVVAEDAKRRRANTR